MDYEHVGQLMSKNGPSYSFPEFDTLVRGWNPFLALALPRMAAMQGIPIQESTEEFRAHVRSILYVLGSYSVIRKAAEMVRGGFLVGEIGTDSVSLRMAERVSADHFLDALEHSKLDALDERRSVRSRAKGRTSIAEIRDQMRSIVFPWDSGHGLMVGYGATENIDEYFIQAVGEFAEIWRRQAGIHPRASLGGTNGTALASVMLLLTSFYLKHIQFVDVGKLINPDTNYPMSLTIWKNPEELALSLSQFTNIPATQIRAAFEVLTVGKQDAAFFADEQKPYIPMFIRFSDNHYVSPVSSIFKNPLEGARMLEEFHAPEFGQALLEHRESWMAEELEHLFLGTRYRRAAGPTKLRRDGRTVTDVDWAAFDVTTGELALFQLKWQDYSSSDVKKQRSRARNFVDQVDRWALNVQGWISEFGTAQLLRSLHIQLPRSTDVSILLFAVGRSNARFASYGVMPSSVDVASSTWPQFVRLRHDLGPASKVFSELHRRIAAESTYPVERDPIPHEVVVQGQRIVLEDVWNSFKEEVALSANSDPGSETPSR